MNTAAEARQIIASNPKPEFAPMPVVYAANMLTAQSFTLSAEDRAGLVARADWVRLICGTTEPEAMSVTVRDCYTHAVIGSLTYQV